MRPQFCCLQSHLTFAQQLWAQIVTKGDTVVDATAGNGYDAEFLAQLALSDSSGHLFCFDIQPEAIDICKKRLALYQAQITYISACHSTLKQVLKGIRPKLIVYNLGYLPGGDKTRTTTKSTTLESLNQALDCLDTGGAISVMLYPGHEMGKVEAEAVLALCSQLDPMLWNVTHIDWINRRAHPQLLLIQKA